MKKLLYIISGLIFLAGISACDDFLDVNSDQDFATSDKTTVDLRLPWIQNYYAYAWGTAGMRANTVGGLLTQTFASGNNSFLAAWDPMQASCTTIYQNWYIASAVNIGPMIEKAEATGAYHYIGAGYCILAMGFMMMLDLHGELPIQEAFKFKTDPAYDDGKTMYELCMDYLDKAIENFNKPQATGPDTKLLSRGDLWNNGDVSKWLKLCHGLKARYMLRLSKKAEFNGDAILAVLANAPQSNSDNTIMKHFNVQGDQTNFTVADPYQTNVLWNTVSYGATVRLTKWYINMLTNNFTGGSGVMDPRMSKLVPAMMKNVKLDASGQIASYEWARDIGVDMLESDMRLVGGPVATIFATTDQTITYTIADDAARAAFYASMSPNHTTTLDNVARTVRVVYKRGSAYCNSTDYRRAGDTMYVSTRANSMTTSGRSTTDMYYYPAAGFNYVAGTGTFYTRPNSDTDFLTYAEMCFIKAEVYFRKGDAANAHTAYLAGIQAHFDRMQIRLNQWRAEGTVNPDEMPMDPVEIAAYMSGPAVCQTPATLTMAEIMRQKTIAMGFDLEVWNDMRRFNYSAGNIGNFGNVYPDYKRPREFTAVHKITGTSPTALNYWPRRFSQSPHESNYNLTQLLASNKMAMTDPIWSCPVWWDCATDQEYYSYIR